MHRFVGIEPSREPAPDETTLCKFRHLLKRHNLSDRLFVLIGEYLQENGLKVSTGTIVDVTLPQPRFTSLNVTSSWRDFHPQAAPMLGTVE